MTDCSRCGEKNRDDARFCGNCGTAIAATGSIASLADEPTTPASDSPTGGLTSEWVAPPTVAETAAPPVAAIPPAPRPSPPPTPTEEATVPTAATPMAPSSHAAGIPTQVTPVAAAPSPLPPNAPVRHETSDDSSRATSIMVAALAVAVVVIVGGIVSLLASGGGDTGTARSGAAATEPIVTEVETSVLADVPVVTSDPTSTEAVATEVPTSTSTTAVPATTAPPTTAPPTTAPPTTAPPTTAPPTVPPTTVPRPTRGPGDLAIAQPILDFPCTGDYVTFVRGIVGGDRLYSEQVEAGLRDFPGSGYLWGGICPSIRTINDDGDQIYGIIYGPFASLAEACAVEADFATEGAYVRQLTQFEADIGRDVC